MANAEHIAKLQQGVPAWNEWRELNPDVVADLQGADLGGANLSRARTGGVYVGGETYRLPPPLPWPAVDLRAANLSGADLSSADLRDANLSAADLSSGNLTLADLRGAKLSEAHLSSANLRGVALFGTNLSSASLTAANLREAHFISTDLRRANLTDADLRGAKLERADLSGANLSEAHLSGADLSGADLRGLNLRDAHFIGTNLRNVDLRGADLSGADLSGADLSGSDLSRADLRDVNLTCARLQGADLRSVIAVHTDFSGSNLSGCYVYGISAWDVTLQGASQSNLVITDEAPHIQVDDLEVAQFMYLLLNNKKIRNVIDTITSKIVLILGRFTPERKAVLEAIREELRQRDYLPILFDFVRPSNRDITETVSTLPHMARFVIADLTEAKSIPQELGRIVPFLPSVPIQPILLASESEYGMYETFARYPWVLKTARYKDQNTLLKKIKSQIIDPAERKAKKLVAHRKINLGAHNNVNRDNAGITED